MVKQKLIISFFYTITTLSLCCEKKNHFIPAQSQEYFLGDKNIAGKNYFQSLTGNKGYAVLKNQNTLYEKNYSNRRDIKVLNKSIISLKLSESISDKKNYKLTLFTLRKGKKIDSIQFYRKVNNVRYESDRYTCLSYLDVKNRKIWQITYFSSDHNKSDELISYSTSKINENGSIIKYDSIYYLNEQLETELSNNNVYY